MQQFERRTRRLLLSSFPLLHRRKTGVEQAGKDSLAHPRGFSNLLDLLRQQGFDGRQTQLVEFTQRDLVHHAGLVQSLGRVVHGVEDGGFCFTHRSPP